MIATIIIAAVAAVVAFFAWANRQTRAAHAAFTSADVESAILTFVAPAHGELSDEWDLFLSWPIDDPALESVRQRCLEATGGDPYNHGDEAIRRVEEILAELRNAPNSALQPTPTRAT